MTALGWLKRPIAHRGLHDASRGVIENTASAFQAALDAGYAIEADVQASGDGEAMLFHDSTLDRLTLETGPVRSRSAEELKDVVFRDTGDRMQSFSELLEQVAGRTPLVIEVKSDWTTYGPLEQRLAAVLTPYQGPVAVMSFDPRTVATFGRAAPQVPRGLVAERFANRNAWPSLGACQRLAMRHLLSAFIATPQFIAYDIRALPAIAPLAARTLLRWPLLTWTVRTEAERRTARRWADAMIFEGFRPDGTD